MGTLILLWGSDSCETFNCRREEMERTALYWIRRRYEKRGIFPERGFFVEGELNVKEIISGILVEESRYAKELQEQQDKQEYERLRIKFGDGKEESHEQKD